MLIKKSGQSSSFQILFALFIAVLSMSGCLEETTSPMQEPSPELSDKLPDVRLQMDYDVELSRDLFRLQGDLLLPGTANLGYILLNASLQKEDSPILSTKYLLMQVESNREYGFEICRSCRLESGEYDCILKAESPQGIIAEEVRKVSLEGSRDGLEGWSLAEETALWRMIEEYEREGDRREKIEGEENKREEIEGEENEKDKEKEGEVAAEEGGIQESVGGGDNPKADDVGKESLEPSYSENSPIALFSGYGARDDEDGISSHEESLVGSKSSRKYHHPDCRFAQKIKPENLISFSGVDDARREGYLPCKFCKP
ncbi:MAG: hypothetical protein LUQ44_06700 [Methanothrix sp.]|nr:hypothetical protein [Methanothrix sp.]